MTQYTVVRIAKEIGWEWNPVHVYSMKSSNIEKVREYGKTVASRPTLKPFYTFHIMTVEKAKELEKHGRKVRAAKEREFLNERYNRAIGK